MIYYNFLLIIILYHFFHWQGGHYVDEPRVDGSKWLPCALTEPYTDQDKPY